VGIIENIRAREAYDWCKATAFNRRAPPPPIREFRTPVLDFKAKTYVTMAPLKLVKGDYDGTDAPKLYKFKAFSLNSTVAKATLVPITEPPPDDGPYNGRPEGIYRKSLHLRLPVPHASCGTWCRCRISCGETKEVRKNATYSGPTDGCSY
jgi:hypothetical protein